MSNQNKQTPVSGSPHLDRWHYLDFRDGKHDRFYIEWKYFNFIQSDLAGYIVYYILSPEGNSEISGGRLLARVFKNGVSVGSLRRIPMGAISCDAISVGIEVDDARIVEHTPYEYALEGTVGGLGWHLTYKQKLPTIESFQNLNPGIMKWERASWLIKMPRAAVRGEIRTNGEIWNVDGLGYSDTNFGEIIPLFSRYEWGQYNSSNLSFVFGIVFGFARIRKSYFYFTFGGHAVSLHDTRCAVAHTAWTRDGDTGLRMPSESRFTFRDAEYEISFSSALLQHDTLGLKASRLMPRPVISEQLVQYTGSIMKNGTALCRFEGTGFEEWSARTRRRASQQF